MTLNMAINGNAIITPATPHSDHPINMAIRAAKGLILTEDPTTFGVIKLPSSC